MATKEQVEAFLKRLKEKIKVFGKNVKGQEVYIKITLGLPNSSTICISFHIAEHKMNYPFKN